MLEYCVFFKDFVYLFDRERERETDNTSRGRGTGRGRKNSLLNRESDVGLNPRTLGS